MTWDLSKTLPSVQRQSGMALLLVLLVFSVASALATAMISRQSHDVQRSTNRFATQQARAYVWGVESVVKSGLYLDWENDPDIDHALEEWAEDRVLPMEDGSIFVRIQDAQGKFNLNWLSAASANREIWQDRFTRLLNQLGLDVELSNSLYQWFDEESNIENTYTALVPPYRPAYRPCKHPSELLLVLDVNLETYRLLEPYISCLPVASQLNINTASEYVLASIDDDFAREDAAQVIADRGDTGIDSVEAFLALEGVAEAAQKKDDEAAWEAEDFTVRSEYFDVFTRVNLGPAGEWLATDEFSVFRQQSDGKLSIRYRNYSRREPKALPQSSISTTSVSE
ncbi:MAG: type II secretion system minor pseudopilin GspK [Oceanobacter sp.]